jgi:NADH-quinone oxidoreductase chain I
LSQEEPRPRGFFDDVAAVAKGLGTVFKQTFRRDNT